MMRVKGLITLYYDAMADRINKSTALHESIAEFVLLLKTHDPPLTPNETQICIFEHIMLNFEKDRHSVWFLLDHGYARRPSKCILLKGLEPALFTDSIRLACDACFVEHLDCESYCHMLADFHSDVVASEVYILLTLFEKNKNLRYLYTFIRWREKRNLTYFLLSKIPPEFILFDK
jgi:hypothetical protein